MLRLIPAALLLLAMNAASAAPDDAKHRYAGKWRIEKSEPAPWAKTPDMIEAKEVKRLTGAEVQFAADHIAGPQPIACKDPNYELKQYPAEGLFQGALEEYGDPSTTPAAMAAKLGFGKEVSSLVTGCASEIEFHELLDGQLAFALNNSIYRMRRQDAPPAPPAKPKGSP